MRRLLTLTVMTCLGSWGCTTTAVVEGTPSAHDNMDAVVWLQTSTEYAASASSVYAAAAAVLDDIALAEADRIPGMAIVLDVDETVLDNSRYQAQLVFDGATYNRETWDEWVELKAAPAVPGAVEFIRYAQAAGFHIAFITNRACRLRPGSDAACPQKDDTLANLQAVGIDTRSVTLLLRGERAIGRCRTRLAAAEQADGTWSRDKSSRRACVGLERDIVMLFGDQLGDFTNERDAAASGRATDLEHGDRWGKSWFMLPNPTYGDWKPTAYPDKQMRIQGID